MYFLRDASTLLFCFLLLVVGFWLFTLWFFVFCFFALSFAFCFRLWATCPRKAGGMCVAQGIWPSEAKYLEESDFDVQKSLAPPKSVKNDEIPKKKSEKKSQFLFRRQKIENCKSSETRFPEVSRRSELSSWDKRAFEVRRRLGGIREAKTIYDWTPENCRCTMPKFWHKIQANTLGNPSHRAILLTGCEKLI